MDFVFILRDHKYLKYEKQSLSSHYKKEFFKISKVLPFSRVFRLRHVPHLQEQIRVISGFVCFVSLGKNSSCLVFL